MVDETILGTSKIDPRYRITLVDPVPELLNIKVGDLVVFVRHKDGSIVIKPSQITKVKSSTMVNLIVSYRMKNFPIFLSTVPHASINPLKLVLSVS